MGVYEDRHVTLLDGPGGPLAEPDGVFGRHSTYAVRFGMREEMSPERKDAVTEIDIDPALAARFYGRSFGAW